MLTGARFLLAGALGLAATGRCSAVAPSKESRIKGAFFGTLVAVRPSLRYGATSPP